MDWDKGSAHMVCNLTFEEDVPTTSDNSSRGDCSSVQDSNRTSTHKGRHYLFEDGCGFACVVSLMGSAVGILAILFNILFLITMRSIKDRRALPYSALLQNLSLADVFASLLFLLTQNWPQGPFAEIEPSRDLLLVQGLPYVFRSTPWMFFTSYLLTLTCLTVCHYVAVCKPWKYTELVERGLVNRAMVGMWLMSSLQILLPVAVLICLCAQKDRRKAMATLYSVSTVEIQLWMSIFATSTCINVILDFMVYKKMKKLKRRRPHCTSSQETRNIRTKHEAFVTVTLLIFASVFCRLPFPLVGILGFNLKKILSAEGLYSINSVVILLLYINFFVDPVIYVLRMKEIRKGFLALFDHCLSSLHRLMSGAHTAAADPESTSPAGYATASTGVALTHITQQTDDLNVVEI